MTVFYFVYPEVRACFPFASHRIVLLVFKALLSSSDSLGSLLPKRLDCVSPVTSKLHNRQTNNGPKQRESDCPIH